MTTNLTDTQTNLLHLLSTALFDQPLQLSDNIDWLAVYNEAMDQSVLPLAFSAAKGVIPDEFRNTWQSKTNLIIGKSMNVSYEHTLLHELMSANNIPYVTIKGLTSAIYYPQPMLRCFGDVDFLVSPDDMDKTEKLILEQGYTKNELETSIHLSYDKKAVNGKFSSHWEMHQSLNGIPDNEAGNLIKEQIGNIIETAIDYDEGNGMVKIPSTYYHGLIILLHTAQHLTREGTGLRHLCDWIVFADYFSDEEFVSIFREKLGAVGLWSFAQLLTLVGEKYLGCPSHAWAGEASDELLASVICDFYGGGNFGVKNSQRGYQARYISNYNDHLIDDKNISRQILSMYDTKARTLCPIVNKLPILLPFAYVYIGVLYSFRVLIGKSRIDNREVLKNAEKRKQIYNSFNLFEIEK